MIWKAQFLDWQEQRDALFGSFVRIADLLQDYLVYEKMPSGDSGERMASCLQDVLENCDVISYEAPGTAEAYAMLHFLDRYHRFQLIYLWLIEIGIFPLRSRPMYILDIGTGPGPALFALSDTYELLRQFGVEVGELSLREVEVHLDYVERSHEFRHWLAGIGSTRF